MISAQAVALHFQDVAIFSVAEVQQIEHMLNVITQHIIQVINTYFSAQLSSP